MSPRRHVRLFVSLLFVLLTFHSAFGQEPPLNGFDDYVKKALPDWEAQTGFFVQFELAESKARA